MVVNSEKCIGCGQCVEVCPLDAITVKDRMAYIDYDICVECGNCKHSGVCKVDAIVQQSMTWPRVIRGILSNVRVAAPNTGIQGRGTEEMKTNDVSGRYRPGMVGIACELGRPSVGTDFRDVEKIAQVLIKHGGHLESDNPMALVFEDLKTGIVKPEFLDERVMSVVLEALFEREALVPLLKDLEQVQIDTVFSLGVASVLEDGKITTTDLIQQAGYAVRPNGKTCVGLGRPRKEL